MSQFLKLREFWLAVLIAALVFATNMRAPGFANPGRLSGIVEDSSILMILALGQMVVILTRSIDLSMASNLALSGMIVALINKAAPGIPVPALMLIATSCGLLLGALNGLFIWRLGIPAIVVTLGSLTIYRGVIFLIAGGQWVNADAFSAAFVAYTRIEFLGLPLLIWYAVAIVAAFVILMSRTALGAPSMRWASIRPRPSMPASMSGARPSMPSACRVCFPASAAISGCRAMSSARWKWRADMS